MIEVIDRRRVVIADAHIHGASQPYHAAKTMGLPEAMRYLSGCADAFQRLAEEAIRELAAELLSRDYRLTHCAVLLAAGRRLPALPEILAAHPLMHTAEGEFFRSVFWRACQGLNLPVTGVRERDLDECARLVFGKASGRVRQRISDLKSSLGPPWTEDQKKASLAAAVVLAARERGLELPEAQPSLEIPSAQ